LALENRRWIFFIKNQPLPLWPLEAAPFVSFVRGQGHTTQAGLPPYGGLVRAAEAKEPESVSYFFKPSFSRASYTIMLKTKQRYNKLRSLIMINQSSSFLLLLWFF